MLCLEELPEEEDSHPHQGTSRVIMQRAPAPILSLSLCLTPPPPLARLYSLNFWRAPAKRIVKKA